MIEEIGGSDVQTLSGRAISTVREIPATKKIIAKRWPNVSRPSRAATLMAPKYKISGNVPRKRFR